MNEEIYPVFSIITFIQPIKISWETWGYNI